MDTIVAIATPAVPSAIGIIRLSGSRAIEAVAGVFTPKSGRALSSYPNRTLVYGTMRDREGNQIDSALATISRGPSSYTGEDTAELQCHGSPTVLGLGLEALFAQGVRQATAGEFTKRAFLNGRLDLTQAEAVVDLIDAQTPSAVHQAAGQLSGALSRRVEGIYSALVDLLAHFHAVLDYPDEDIDPFGAATMEACLSAAQRELSALMDTYQRGKFIARGVPCAIVGRPNGGKSSLLNALLGYERAIVTDVAGTTRDTIEERTQLGGVLLRLIDTAGIRETEDAIERMGVERSEAAMAEAELILVLVDGTEEMTAEDAALLSRAKEIAPTILVRTKADIATPEGTECDVPTLPISAHTGAGLEKLGELVTQLFPMGAGERGEMLTNARQMEAATRGGESIQRAREALENGLTPDMVLTDVEDAITALGELTGRTMREDVTSRIFERFCVGK